MSKIPTIAWFEIPVSDMSRAQNFYETVFDTQIKIQEFEGILMGWFPLSENGPSGSLVKHQSYIPSQKGSLLYFTSVDINTELNRVEDAGGTVYQHKTQISPEHGYMGVFMDTEGNRIALHSLE